MDYAHTVIKKFKNFQNLINPATLSGAIDVVVVEQPDGEYKSTPFHVRFGKYGVISCSNNYVDIAVNGVNIDLKMKLGDCGVAFFVDDEDDEDRDCLASEHDHEATEIGESAVEKVLEDNSVKLEETKIENEKIGTRRKSRSLPPYSDGELENEMEPKQEPLSEDDINENYCDDFMEPIHLSSDMLKSLGLNFGANEIRFSITTKLQGTTFCSCDIYLYKWYEQLVISDIDGTITKSDVLGHVIPAIGGTWDHNGVAELYTRIKNNGYQLVYLSSRAIGHSHATKQYLKNVTQDSIHLPDGPVLLSPTSTITAFTREVIERRPEVFKIAALTDLKNLFPSANPFYAGFGNRDTDVVSYEAVAVPTARILIIDPSGKVRRATSSGPSPDYKSIATDTVDFMFPPLPNKIRNDDRKKGPHSSSWSKPLNHSDFTHWHMKPEDIHDEELKEYESHRKKLMEKQKSRK